MAMSRFGKVGTALTRAIEPVATRPISTVAQRTSFVPAPGPAPAPAPRFVMAQTQRVEPVVHQPPFAHVPEMNRRYVAPETPRQANEEVETQPARNETSNRLNLGQTRRLISRTQPYIHIPGMGVLNRKLLNSRFGRRNTQRRFMSTQNNVNEWWNKMTVEQRRALFQSATSKTAKTSNVEQQIPYNSQKFFDAVLKGEQLNNVPRHPINNTNIATREPSIENNPVLLKNYRENNNNPEFRDALRKQLKDNFSKNFPKSILRLINISMAYISPVSRPSNTGRHMNVSFELKGIILEQILGEAMCAFDNVTQVCITGKPEHGTDVYVPGIGLISVKSNKEFTNTSFGTEDASKGYPHLINMLKERRKDYTLYMIVDSKQDKDEIIVTTTVIDSNHPLFRFSENIDVWTPNEGSISYKNIDTKTRSTCNVNISKSKETISLNLKGDDIKNNTFTFKFNRKRPELKDPNQRLWYAQKIFSEIFKSENLINFINNFKVYYENSGEKFPNVVKKKASQASQSTPKPFTQSPLLPQTTSQASQAPEASPKTEGGRTRRRRSNRKTRKQRRN